MYETNEEKYWKVEQGDVCEEHCYIHCRRPRVFEVAYEGHSSILYLKAYILIDIHLPIALNTAVLVMCEDKPGGAVEQREYPAGEDDPLGPRQGADVLNQ